MSSLTNWATAREWLRGRCSKGFGISVTDGLGITREVGPSRSRKKLEFTITRFDPEDVAPIHAGTVDLSQWLAGKSISGNMFLVHVYRSRTVADHFEL